MVHRYPQSNLNNLLPPPPRYPPTTRPGDDKEILSYEGQTHVPRIVSSEIPIHTSILSCTLERNPTQSHTTTTWPAVFHSPGQRQWQFQRRIQCKPPGIICCSGWNYIHVFVFVIIIIILVLVAAYASSSSRRAAGASSRH